MTKWCRCIEPDEFEEHREPGYAAVYCVHCGGLQAQYDWGIKVGKVFITTADGVQ